MTPKPEDKRAYERKLAEYRKEVSSNDKKNQDIQRHEVIRAELEAKIQRLEDAKSKINSENAQLTEVMRKLEQPLNAELFQGKNEDNYTTQKKNPAKDDAQKFLNGINGDANSVIQQITNKINELRASAESETNAISSIFGTITHPVAPKKPTGK